MKDHEKQKSGLELKPKSPEDLPGKSKARGASKDLLHDLTAHGMEPDAERHGAFLSNENLSHPANAEPLAGVLGQLQQSYGNLYVQRLVSEAGEEKSPGEAGQPLEAGTKAAMESAFGEDFGAVRIHTNDRAQRAAEALEAKAFTQGHDIYFGPGEYDPATRQGKELLAHELTHVIQQRGSSADPQAKSMNQVGDAFEREANRAVPVILAGQRPELMNRSGAPALQREEKKRETPMISHHAQEITPMPPSGTIDAAGHFAVAYFYNIVSGADFVPLTLTVPGGVAVAVIPLADMSAGDYRVIDPGGTGARAVSISVSAHLRALPRIQVTLTQGSFTYLVVLQFMQSSKSASEKKE